LLTNNSKLILNYLSKAETIIIINDKLIA